jgi:hypothetical protein
MSNKHKSEDHKINAVQYYLSDESISQLKVCNIFYFSILKAKLQKNGRFNLQ